MAIRNSNLGGTDWNESTEEDLFGSDLNDTFNAVSTSLSIEDSSYVDFDAYETSYTTHKTFDFTASDLNKKLFSFKWNLLKYVRNETYTAYYKILITYTDLTTDNYTTSLAGGFNQCGLWYGNHNSSKQIKQIEIQAYTSDSSYQAGIYSDSSSTGPSDIAISNITYLSWGDY